MERNNDLPLRLICANQGMHLLLVAYQTLGRILKSSKSIYGSMLAKLVVIHQIRF